MNTFGTFMDVQSLVTQTQCSRFLSGCSLFIPSAVYLSVQVHWFPVCHISGFRHGRPDAGSHKHTHTHNSLSLSLRLAHTPMHTCLAHMCPIMHSNSCDCVHASTHKAHLQKNTRWKYSIWIVHLTVIVQLEHSCICIDLMEVYICTRTNTQTHTSFLDYAVSVLLVVYAD